MKTKNKIRILFLSVLTVVVLFLIGYQYMRSREINIYLQSKHLSDEKVVDKVLDLKAASFLKPTIDNSAWDGMVEFIKSRDFSWAEENLVGVLKTFDMSYLGVYDVNGKSIYSTADTNDNLIRLSDNEIREWFANKKTVHTFIKQNESIYEVFAAVVVPSFDINYTTKEKGYLVSAKKWDSEYITEVSTLTGFNLDLYLSFSNIDTTINGNEENIYRQLNDFQNNPLASIRFSKHNEFQAELSNIQTILYFGFGILFFTIIIFLYLTNKWLTKPLKNITDSLEEGDLSYIQNLLNQKNEFGNIANLVKKFNEQKDNLLKEVKEKTEATEKYKALLEAQPDLIFIFDKAGTYLDFYTPNVNLLIDNPENLIGSNIKDYFELNLANKFIEILRTVSEFNKVKPVEYDLNLSDAKHTFEARFVAIDNNRILTIVRDVTERKLSEEALKYEKRLSDAIIETLPGGFFMTDFEGNYIRRNEYSYNLNKKDLKEDKEENIFQYVYSEDLESAKIAFQEANDTGHAEIELRFEFQHSTIKWFYISVQKLITYNNYFFIGTSLETTKRKQAEQELIKAKEKAEESEKLKSNFLSNMSHELRTPMVGILGFSDLLRSELDDEELHNMADKIFKSGNRLMETLNLILDLSRIEAGKLETHYKEFDVSETITNSISLYIQLIEAKGLKINYENKDISIIVNLDERMVRDILNNLINNALKYTDSGSINIKANEITKNDIPYVSIEVQDTGIGIPADMLDVVFEEFRQVSEGLSRGFEGTGLGLSLTKKFVEKMNGFVTVTSEFGKGSVFTVTMPVNYNKISNKQNTIKEPNIPVVIQNEEIYSIKKKYKILVVDNDDTTLLLVNAFLNDYYFIDTAKSGKEAINLVHLNKYDLILMDINLGKDDDGISVTKKIRKIKEFKYVPVIALTAYAMAGDREKFISLGCTDYVSKPFLKQDLLNLIKQILQ